MACAERRDLEPEINAVASDLVQLGTRDFLGFLDVGVVPRPQRDRDLHPAGIKHEPADYCCRCWTHRECIDQVADRDESAKPLAEIFLAAAMLRKSGVPLRPQYRREDRTNFVIDGIEHPIGIVHPLDFSPEAAEKRLRDARNSTSVSSPYIIWRAGARARSLEINAGIAIRRGARNAGLSSRSRLKAIYQDEFLDAFRNGTLRGVIDRLIA